MLRASKAAAAHNGATTGLLTGLRSSPRSWSCPDCALCADPGASPFCALSESRRCIAPRIANTCLGTPVFDQLFHVLVVELRRMKLFEVVSNVTELEANAVPLRQPIDTIEIPHPAVGGVLSHSPVADPASA